MKAAVIGIKLTDKWDSTHKKIKDVLEKDGIKVDFSYFKTTTAEDAEDLEKTYKRNNSLIKNADFIVAETTDYSGGIGYLIATALSNRKPVLALFNTEADKKPSNIIKASASSKLLTFAEYNTKTLDKNINDFTRKVKALLDTKFILIISPEIDRYLEWAGDYKRMHKAQIVREAVEEMMKRDKEWKEFTSDEV